MLIQELIGKTITNIYSFIETVEYCLDSGQCYIELDAKIIVAFPFGFQTEVFERTPEKNATSLFDDLSDYPIYYVNKANKSIQEIIDDFHNKNESFWGKLKNYIFGKPSIMDAYKPYKIEYKENKLKFIKDQKIVDIIYIVDDDVVDEKVFLLLENGYLISEILMAPNGTGAVGLHIYDNFDKLIEYKGENFRKFSDVNFE